MGFCAAIAHRRHENFQTGVSPLPTELPVKIYDLPTVSSSPPGSGPENPYDFRWKKSRAPFELKIGGELAECGSFNIKKICRVGSPNSCARGSQSVWKPSGDRLEIVWKRREITVAALGPRNRGWRDSGAPPPAQASLWGPLGELPSVFVSLRLVRSAGRPARLSGNRLEIVWNHLESAETRSELPD